MINTALKTEQTYYAECRLPDEERGLRMAVTLTKTAEDQDLPDLIPAYPCMSESCPDGGTHDLLPIPGHAADKLMADEDDPEMVNVFEWCLEHADVDGDDQRMLLYLAFHAEDNALSLLPFDSDCEDDLQIGSFDAHSAMERLISGGWLAVCWETCGYRFPAFEAWQEQQR